MNFKMTQNSASEKTVDVGSQRVARVYAEALLGAAEKVGQETAVLDELDSLVAEVFQVEPRMETLLSSAAVGRYARRDILEKLFAGRGSKTLYNFLQVLNDHERLDLLRPIRVEMRQLIDQKSRRVRVQVTAATAVPADQQQKLQSDLQKALQREPVLEWKIDPEILGGLKVRVGDWQYDASVRSRLENLRQQILASSSHEIQSGRDRFSIADGN